MRVALVATTLMAALGAAPPGPSSDWRPLSVSADRIATDPAAQALAPGVRFVGGLNLRSRERRFGGLSDLKRGPDGRWWALGDTGELLRFTLDGADAVPTGWSDVEMRRLADDAGRPLADKAGADAEGLVVTPGGDVLISFEVRDRIRRYAGGDGAGSAVPSPDRRFPRDAGMEALASAPDGGWLVGGESGGFWLCAPSGCRVLTPPPAVAPIPSDFRTTGADRDPAGHGWWIVERSYRAPISLAARVRRLSADGVLGPPLITLRRLTAPDNFEGVAAVARPGGTRLFLLSDDGFNGIQRSVLLAYDVQDRP